MEVDLRLDQSPGIWLTAVGSTPLALFDRELPDRPMKIAVQSSAIGLGVLEGLTDAVRDVAGQLVVDMTVVGTSRDPHFTGSIEVTNAGFLVTATGARYKNGQAALRLAADRITVQSFTRRHASRSSHEGILEPLAAWAPRNGRGCVPLRVVRRVRRVDVDGSSSFRGQFGRRGQGRHPVVGASSTSTNFSSHAAPPYATTASAPGVDAILPFIPGNDWVSGARMSHTPV